MCRLSCLAVLVGIFCLGMPSFAADSAWTTIRGRIVLDGDVPEPASVDVTRDEEYCGEFGLMDQSLLVHPENNGLRNVAIYLRAKEEVPVHPSYAEPKSVPAKLDNVRCEFVPRMACLRTGQVWQVTSSDPIAHNVAVYARRNDPFSEVIPRGQALEKSFSRAESQPVRIDCSIHAWMRAYIIITDHPYSAVTDKDGRFEIAHVPRGSWTFRFWHERPGYLRAVKQGTQSRTLKSGSWELDLAEDILDLGDVTVESGMFTE